MKHIAPTMNTSRNKKLYITYNSSSCSSFIRRLVQDAAGQAMFSIARRHINIHIKESRNVKYSACGRKAGTKTLKATEL